MKALQLLVLSLLAGQLHATNDPYPYRFEGLFEKCGAHELIRKFVDSDSVILEAGGFDGTDSLNLAETVSNGKLITFEPNPSRYVELVAKTEALPHVKTVPYALGEVNGTITFYLCYGYENDPIYEGASSALAPSDSMKENYKGPVIEVPCVVLDDWCHDNNVDHIDFIWLDLEGYELNVLKSSPRILKTVKAIFSETNFYQFRVGTTMYPDLRSFLEENGFELLSHWYNVGLQGNALFVRKEIYNETVQKIMFNLSN